MTTNYGVENMSKIKRFIENVEEFVNNHELTFPSMSQEEIRTILKDVYVEFGSMGKEHARDYIKQQQISY
tara:strand:- start:617 stop:826 length:210 start_codon:yes stop_codon:yes gene_type:complete